MMGEKELTQLASLARINLTTAEQAGLLNDLGAILDYVDQLKQAAPTGKGSTFKTQSLKVESWKTVPVNVLREDNPSAGGAAAAEAEKLRAAAPTTEGPYFKVKAIFGDKNGGS
ncbi:MAG: aspartyl/glutamyl-tRNA amidotransferase subunit C [Candidatus Vogelbacteria bacterium]|nr:aspartyl/glutamyl-tRNA amidotransferase subunit C [Candidatus Vogelbacteria bacterium]